MKWHWSSQLCFIHNTTSSFSYGHALFPAIGIYPCKPVYMLEFQMSLSRFTVKPLEIHLTPPKYSGSLVHRSFSMTLCGLLPLSLGRNSTCQNRKIPLQYLCITRTRKEALKSLPNWPEVFCNLVKSFCLREVLRRSQMYLSFFSLFYFLAYMSTSFPSYPFSQVFFWD